MISSIVWEWILVVQEDILGVTLDSRCVIIDFDKVNANSPYTTVNSDYMTYKSHTEGFFTLEFFGTFHTFYYSNQLHTGYARPGNYEKLGNRLNISEER